MDFNDKVKYLTELFQNLVDDVSVEVLCNGTKYEVYKGVSEEDVLPLVEPDEIYVTVSGLYGGRRHVYSNPVNLLRCRYFTKGQGKAVAKSFKIGLAESMLNFR